MIVHFKCSNSCFRFKFEILYFFVYLAICIRLIPFFIISNFEFKSINVLKFHSDDRKIQSWLRNIIELRVNLYYVSIFQVQHFLKFFNVFIGFWKDLTVLNILIWWRKPEKLQIVIFKELLSFKCFLLKVCLIFFI